MRYKLMSIVKCVFKVIVLVVAAAFFVFGIPAIINECYVSSNPCYFTIWGAEEVLSYYGTLLAAAGTGLGVFFSIKYSQKQYQEDKRHGVLPYFSVDKLIQEKESLFFRYFNTGLQSTTEQQSDESEQYREYLPDRIYFIIDDDSIKCTLKLTQEQKEVAESSQDIFKDDNGKLVNQSIADCFVLRLQNVGNGCAVNTTIAVLDFGKEQMGKRKDQTPRFSVNAGKTVDVCIFAYCKDSSVGRYNLKLLFQDIYGNKYSENLFFNIEKQDEKYSLAMQKGISHDLMHD